MSGLLLLVAASSMAMSLGRHSGAALIGRPLDISVQALLEAQDNAGNLCLEADVFYADNKLDKSRVRVTLERSVAIPAQALIRIRSAALIDEPVVTVHLRVGCQLKTERRYVSLAELVSEATPDKRASATVVPVEPGNPNPVEAAPVQPASELGQISKRKAQRTPTTTKDSKPAAFAKARLKLEPLDLTIDRDPQLKPSAELLSIPAANPQERAAASALWRALSAQPQDVLRDTEKLQALENSVRGLQAQSQKTVTAMDDLNLKLQEAQAQRYANLLIYLLLALLLAALAGLAYLLRHRWLGDRGESGDRPWWRKSDAYKSQQEAWIDSSPSTDHHKLNGLHEAVKSSSSPTPKSPRIDVDVDFDLDPASVSSRGVRAHLSPAYVDSIPLALKDRSDFGSSLLHPSRAAKAEELFDVQQQADFFVSIGQHEQAIEVLQSHIGENRETSALVYLDLFNLYHQLGRRAEYESLRSGFNQRFNAEIPAFELYTDKNLGLEAYQHALSRIEVLWPSPKVLEIIEESLFRHPNNQVEAFNLEAYRELLLLYSVAREIISPESKRAGQSKKFDFYDRSADSADSRPMTFSSTAIQPLSARMDMSQRAEEGVSATLLMASVIPPSSRRLGLDIDLDELSAPDKALDFVKESDAKFFANFDADATAALPVINASHQASNSSTTDADNLIDFDIFDGPLITPEKFKPPRV